MTRKLVSILIVGMFLITFFSTFSVVSMKLKETEAGSVPPVPNIVQAGVESVDYKKIFDPNDNIYTLAFSTEVNENGVYIQFSTEDGNSNWLGPFNVGNTAVYKYTRTWGSVHVKARASYNPSGSPASGWTQATSMGFSKSKPAFTNALPSFLNLLPRLGLLLNRYFVL